MLLRLIGQGGMGAVWRARDERLGRSVAVKTMAERLIDSPVALERFEREARAIAKLRSPHIVQIHDFGVDGFPYMVMELLKGQPLNLRLRTRRLDLIETNALVRQTCKALGAAHAGGIVHRDLKPGNIFLEKTPDDEEIVKVIDFGLAKAFNVITASAITQVGMMMGTPRYMSPEHFGAVKKVDARADLWSLAVIAYRALTQKLPFDGTPQEIAAQVLNGSPPPITTIDPGLPPELDSFFRTAFAKKREDRFPDARAFAMAFNTAIPGASDFSLSRPDGELEELDTHAFERKPRIVLTQVLPPDTVDLPRDDGESETTTELPANHSIQRDMPPMVAGDADPTISMSAMMNVSLSPTLQRRRRQILPAAVLGAVVGLGGLTLAVTMLLTGEPPARAASVLPQPLGEGVPVSEVATEEAQAGDEAAPVEEQEDARSATPVAATEQVPPRPRTTSASRKSEVTQTTPPAPPPPSNPFRQDRPDGDKGQGNKKPDELFRQPF